jgi:hypothetical protein
VPRTKVLKELLNYDMPLFCPTWFSTQLWIMQFDEDLGPLARKIWNKFGLVLRSGVLDYEIKDSQKNLWYYLADDDFGVHGLTVRGISSALEVFGASYMDSHIDYLI